MIKLVRALLKSVVQTLAVPTIFKWKLEISLFLKITSIEHTLCM